MSAFIVDREDIDVLVTALNAAGIVAGTSVDFTGRMLWAENLASIHYRYPDTLEGGEYPAHIDFRASGVDTYTWTPNAAGLNAAEVREVAKSYEYQSCEHPGWSSSAANAAMGRLAEAVSCGRLS